MRIVFMGSPEFALPSLRRLIESPHQVVAVVTQPDRPAGRGRRLEPPPVKRLALEEGLPVLQPERVSADESVAALAALEPDVIVIAAFGQILRQRVLDVPKRGALNVHASLLPKYRGAAPIPAAIIAGERETGVTIMEVVRALDAGPVVAQRAIPIDPADTTGTLTGKLAQLGGDLLSETLEPWVAGTLRAEPQDESRATYAAQVRREDARLDWRLPAEDLWRRVRAYNPWPVAFTELDGTIIRVLEATPLDIEPEGPPGRVFTLDGGGFAVRCGRGSLAVVKAQRPGGRPLPAAEFLRGLRDLPGRVLGKAA